VRLRLVAADEELAERVHARFESGVDQALAQSEHLGVVDALGGVAQRAHVGAVVDEAPDQAYRNVGGVNAGAETPQAPAGMVDEDKPVARFWFGADRTSWRPVRGVVD
jgi:hypothetical protein